MAMARSSRPTTSPPRRHEPIAPQGAIGDGTDGFFQSGLLSALKKIASLVAFASWRAYTYR